MGFSDYPWGLGSQVAGGINVSRASKSWKYFCHVRYLQEPGLCSSCRAGGFVLLWASSLLSPSLKWALLGASPETGREIEMRGCVLCSALDGVWCSHSFHCSCTKSPLSVCSGHVLCPSCSACCRPCPFGQIYVTSHPCTMTSTTGNNEGSRCTLFLNYSYFITIYK